MRLSQDESAMIKKTILRHVPEATVYLFGSRTNDLRKGGDIDILILGRRRLSLMEQSDVRYQFERCFGEQKLDLVSMLETDNDPFKTLILKEAVRL